MIEVKKSERKDNKKGVWLVLNYINDKGEEKQTNIFDKAVVEQFKGPGKYDVKWVKKGEYYNVAELIQEGAAASPSNGNHKAPSETPVSGTGQIKANIAIAAIGAAGEVVAAMVRQGFFKPEERATVGDYVTGIADILGNGAVSWVKGAKSTSGPVEGA